MQGITNLFNSAINLKQTDLISEEDKDLLMKKFIDLYNADNSGADKYKHLSLLSLLKSLCKIEDYNNRLWVLFLQDLSSFFSS